jgi:hypothetical protein
MNAHNPSTLLAALLTGAATLALLAGTAAAGAQHGLDPEPQPQALLPSLSLDPDLVDETTQQDLKEIAYYRRTYRRRTYRSRYYTPGVYVAPAPVVVVHADPDPVIVTDPPIVKTGRRSPRTSLTLRSVALNYGDSQLNGGSLDGAEVGGFGVGLRVGLDKHWGLELAVDILGGQQQGAEMAVLPITASLMARLFPESRLDVYGLAGGGVYQTAIRYDDLPDETYLQLGAHAGGGVELKFGHLLLTADVRFLLLEARPALVNNDRTASQGLVNDNGGQPAPRERQAPEDEFQGGLQGMLGVGYRW